MPFELQYRDGDEYMRIIPRDLVELSDLLEIMEAISGEGRYICNRRLWDLRFCTLNIDSAGMQRVAEIGRALDNDDDRAAVLADTDLNYGLSRLHLVYRTSEREQSSVFRTEEEALAWLLR